VCYITWGGCIRAKGGRWSRGGGCLSDKGRVHWSKGAKMGFMPIDLDGVTMAAVVQQGNSSSPGGLS
jgi:hypothetical protein